MSLIIPLVSAGNVPQLAVDLLLHSSDDQFEYVRSIDGILMHPFVGPLDRGTNAKIYSGTQKQYTNPLELFYSKPRDCYILQFRTPIIEGYINNFILDVILPLLRELQIERLYFWDSISDFETYPDFHPEASKVSFGVCEVNSVSAVVRDLERSLMINEGQSDYSTRCKLFEFTSESQQKEIAFTSDVFKFSFLIINARLPTLKRIEYASLFVHEGDNSYDAITFLKAWLIEVRLLSEPRQYAPPESWKGVYGLQSIPDAFEEGLYS